MILSPYARREKWLYIYAPTAILIILLVFLWPYSIIELLLIGWFIFMILFAAYFFRHPNRAIHPDDSILFSPADGTITDIEKLESYNDVFDGPCYRISMFLSVFNVHINRLPCNGKVMYQKYKKGKYINAMNKECVKVNESNEIGIKGVPHYDKCAIKQVSGAIARRIVCEVNEGEKVYQGFPYGMIKFGSRTDIIFPAKEECSILIQKGEKVKGGITKLVKIKTALS